MATRNKKKNKNATPTKNNTPKTRIATAILDSLEFITSMITTTIAFLVILGISVGVGYVVHLVPLIFPWIPEWTLMVLTGVESLLFIVDCVALVFSVIMHLKHKLWDDDSH